MHADLIIANAAALTLDPSRPTAAAVALRGERIVYVGDNAGADELRGPATRLIDAAGATLLPGFVDTHFHLLRGALKLDDLHLGAADTFAELRELLRAHAAANPDLPWLVGHGVRYAAFAASARSPRELLDEVVGDRPALLYAFDAHTAWASTRALELGGALHGAACGPNSEVVLGADGRATGELREPGAFDPLARLVPPPPPARRRALLQRALAEAAACGITSIHNMDGDEAQLALYQQLEAAGELTLRILLPLSVTPETPPAALLEAAEWRARCRGTHLQAGSVKLFMDGVIEGYTGLLVDPYADRPETRGAANYEPGHFAALVTAADRLGLQVCVHAIGDAAVRRALDGFAAARAANGPRDSRHRVEHVELVHPADIGRFAALGVIASMQPRHAPVPPGYGPIWLERVGPARWPWSFAWDRLQAAGARLVFGSDWPVVEMDPLLGLQAALTRPSYAAGGAPPPLTLGAALAASTRDAAYAGFHEHERGLLRVGMLADLVLLSADITRLPAAQLTAARPLLTVSGGRIVYP